MSGLPGEYDRSPGAVTSLMLSSDHHAPMVFDRKRLYGRKSSPRRPANKGQSGPAGGRGVQRELKRRRNGTEHRYCVREGFPGGILMLITFPERALAGQCPERLPIKPPPAMLQRMARKGRRLQGMSRTLLRWRMLTGCPPPGLRWRAP